MALWQALLVAACTDDDRTKPDPDSSPPHAGAGAGAAGVPDSAPDPSAAQGGTGMNAGRSSDPNGQTGSMGALECMAAVECSQRTEARLAMLRTPAPRTFPGLLPGACAATSVITDQATFSGNACDCAVEGATGSHRVGPEGAGCFVEGRARNCLWDDSEWNGCDPTDPRACVEVCAELQARFVADAAHSFEVQVLASACDEGHCRSAVEVDGRCFVAETRSGEYDCSLGGEAILDQARMELPDPPASAAELAIAITPYEQGSDGFVQLTVSQAFVGAERSEPGFGLFAQFFPAIERAAAARGELIDPLSGVDDCGVFRNANLGGGDVSDWLQVGSAVLRDGSERVELEEFQSGDLFSYGAELDRTPRFGERYGIRVEGGDFGAAFDSDALELPQTLSLAAFEAAAPVPRAALSLQWTGTGGSPLRIRLMHSAKLSDLGGGLDIICLVEDDGEFTIPAAVMQAVPDGFVDAYVTRANRALHEDGGHNVLLDAKVENTYRFALGDTCDASGVLAACQEYAAHEQEVYTSCGVPPRTTAEICPSYLASSCVGCREYFACKIRATRCDAGLSTGQCACN
jgi:hypothetical protein